MSESHKDSPSVQRAIGGDKAAFDSLVRGAIVQVRAVVRRLVGHPEDSEDIIQEALLKAWKSIGAFRGESRFSTWLVAIAARTAIDHLRGQKRWRAEAQIAYANLCATSEEMSGEVMGAYSDPAFSFEVRQHISYCFTCVGRSLPPDEQAVLVLRDVMGMSAREACSVLGISDSVMRHSLSTARTAMEERYDNLCALVNKQGMCHQCKGLREIADEQRKGSPLPFGMSFEQRCQLVAAADADGGSCRSLHDVFWRGTKRCEDAGIGSITPDSQCGVDDSGLGSGPAGQDGS